ncbi:Related to HTH domain of SpoOJ/ParA/ParB/repB family, involved in chromosome partitioning [hydrothermal vent metagenome]|uniref:Related to HTH domain of SpoOJ/ParA/ParB/repB family, involved in chromosome partitioning n=1 Tax=hydrothermal vent metagenome TaxID=652676 RepID=A0A3B0UQ93_9ZZZZ
MAIVKPFKGLRPPKDRVEEVSCLPYDVMNSEEAAKMVDGKEASLLRITRAEIEFDNNINPHDEKVYLKAKSNFKAFQEKGFLIQDDEAHYYIYAQTMNGKTQYGIVGDAACDDYLNGIIKKHELTRPDKEEDRKALTRNLEANIEPVFFTYRAVPEIDAIVSDIVTNNRPEYDFTAEDGFGHHFWVIEDAETNKTLEKLFREKVPYTYVADGHHRTAAAAGMSAEFSKKNPNHTGNEAYNYFMAVHFPDTQLQIIDYNRVVKDLNGLSPTEFLKKINENFGITQVSESIVKPEKLHDFSMYLDGKWYGLTAKKPTYNDNNPVDSLDVSVLSKYVLEPILDIKNLRTDTRIDFVGGIRGLSELSKRVDSGEMAAAFALFPVSMNQLMKIADTNNIMPPKVTWFEPKLRSGLIINKLD